jgi:galactokinase
MARLERPGGAVRRALCEIYGNDATVTDERLALIRRVLIRFIERFGDRPVRVFRCPGRINLRGMHVDTHGGYLNLMTHQREVAVAAASETDGAVTFVNVDPAFEPVAFSLGAAISHPAFRDPWLSYIMHADVRTVVEAQRGHWGNYIKGCFLALQHRFPRERVCGMSAVLGADVPRGAALSSSAALCVAVTAAALACSSLTLDTDNWILAARDAEWFTGSRCGLSDQAATILGGRDQLVNVVLYPARLDTASARRLRFPKELRVLVVNSYTERSLSGAALVDYTRNRFAYSLAMEILRQEMRAQGVPDDIVGKTDRLAHLTPEILAPIGGTQGLLGLLRCIPEIIFIADLRQRYDLPNLDEAYEQCFGAVPTELRPTTIHLRGPLLFGIAESERARMFIEALGHGDYAGAGQLMTSGHDGDRVVCADGGPYRYDVSDEALSALMRADTPIARCPGVYRASTPVLDLLVDTALNAGALGASLTGAGMAGTVLALCRAEQAGPVARTVRSRMAAPDYSVLARRADALTPEQLAQAVVVNTATASAGELALPA